MEWIRQYSFFLFDFDGLLVNTEKLHFQAYQQLCRGHGFELNWTLQHFFQQAHFTATGIQEALYKEFPELYRQEPCWQKLYAEKKALYQKLLAEGALELMPGVASILASLEKYNIRRCVVTHSPAAPVDLIRSKLPLLNSIPIWITREFYREAKPSPDGYKVAISMLGKVGDRMIGFEDTIRGYTALKGAGIEEAILICPANHPQLDGTIESYSTFEEFCHFKEQQINRL